MLSSNVRTTADQIDRANATGLTPVVFVHGLWLLPSSWDRWAAVFEEAAQAWSGRYRAPGARSRS
jgi:hypothetical protein